MKLFRHGLKGFERPGVVNGNGEHLDLGDVCEDFDEAFFRANGLEKIRELLRPNAVKLPSIKTPFRFGPVVKRPSKIVCIGLNYVEHVKETGSKQLEEPLLFTKATTALCGPGDDVITPRGSIKLDYEVELALVIGREASYIPESEALDYIAGFTLMNDYSERAFQKERGGQFVKGKSADSFAPLGPYLVPQCQLKDLDSLQLWLKVNGEIRQDSPASLMIFKVPFLISYISQFMRLLPGDVISTGTPSGVGLGMDPPRFLKPGDIVEYGISAIGETRQTVVAHLS